MSAGNNDEKAKRILGWIGISCLLLIIPVKAIRFVSAPFSETLLVGIAPSLLGPAGFLFLILASSGRLSRLTLPQATLLVGLTAVGFEFLQILPRPGMLATIHYTFDWLDVASSLVSVLVAYFVARSVMRLR